MPFQFSCLSATERRSTAAKRDDLHSKSLFLVKNKGQWNAKSGRNESVRAEIGQILHTDTRGKISSKDYIRRRFRLLSHSVNLHYLD